MSSLIYYYLFQHFVCRKTKVLLFFVFLGESFLSLSILKEVYKPQLVLMQLRQLNERHVAFPTIREKMRSDIKNMFV